MKEEKKETVNIYITKMAHRIWKNSLPLLTKFKVCLSIKQHVGLVIDTLHLS